MKAPARQIRCAIYTRKSTEEGLEQDYNSLHAQRDACAAYILSQAGGALVRLQMHDFRAGLHPGHPGHPRT